MSRRFALWCVLCVLPMLGRAQAAPAKDPLFAAVAAHGQGALRGV